MEMQVPVKLLQEVGLLFINHSLAAQTNLELTESVKNLTTLNGQLKANNDSLRASLDETEAKLKASDDKLLGVQAQLSESQNHAAELQAKLDAPKVEVVPEQPA